MRNILVYILAAVLTAIGAIPKKVMLVLYGIVSTSWIISMAIVIIRYFNVENLVFNIIQITFVVMTVILVIWIFCTTVWKEHLDCINRLEG